MKEAVRGRETGIGTVTDTTVIGHTLGKETHPDETERGSENVVTEEVAPGPILGRGLHVETAEGHLCIWLGHQGSTMKPQWRN